MFVVFACSPDQDVENEVTLNQPTSQTENNTVVNDGEQESEENITKQSGDDTVFSVVEQMPEYEGGRDALIADLVKGIVYPESAKQAGVQAKVFIGFVIDKEGNIQSPEIIKIVSVNGGEISLDESIEEDFTSAAIEAISGLKKWKPGMQEGKPVKVKYALPIAFKLN